MPSFPKFGGGAKKGATDFFHLSLAYAKQEAWGPIVAQAKTLAKGLAGAVVMAAGTVLLAIGFVRALQTEFGGPPAVRYAPLTAATAKPVTVPTYPYGLGGHLTGSLSWVPYMGGALLCLAVVGWCVMRVIKVAK